MHFLYNLFIQLYGLGIRVASLWNPKAKRWIKGRKNAFEKLEQFKAEHPENFWIHCASLGEFEQSIPLWKGLKKEYPNHGILISFFSPSGYDAVEGKFESIIPIYLPLDTQTKARKWIDILQPQASFFIKYEFWENYLSTLNKRNIPNYLVSGIFRKEQSFFRKGPFNRSQVLKYFTHLFVQNKESQELLKAIGISQSSITGDTRFERVLELSKQEFSHETLNTFCADSNILMAGSVWNSDQGVLQEIIDALPDDWKIILAPHDLEQYNYPSFGKKTSRLSEFDPSAKILYLDELGLLSRSYRYAQLAYVGGGFEKGIHNILEAAVYKIPVFIGQKHQKFQEAQDLLALHSVIEINESELKNLVSLAQNGTLRAELGDKSYNYINENSNATDSILVLLKKDFE